MLVIIFVSVSPVLLVSITCPLDLFKGEVDELTELSISGRSLSERPKKTGDNLRRVHQRTSLLMDDSCFQVVITYISSFLTFVREDA